VISALGIDSRRITGYSKMVKWKINRVIGNYVRQVAEFQSSKLRN